MFIFHNNDIWLEAFETLLQTVRSVELDIFPTNVSETAEPGDSGNFGLYVLSLSPPHLFHASDMSNDFVTTFRSHCASAAPSSFSKRESIFILQPISTRVSSPILARKTS